MDLASKDRLQSIMIHQKAYRTRNAVSKHLAHIRIAPVPAIGALLAVSPVADDHPEQYTERL